MSRSISRRTEEAAEKKRAPPPTWCLQRHIQKLRVEKVGNVAAEQNLSRFGGDISFSGLFV